MTKQIMLRFDQNNMIQNNMIHKGKNNKLGFIKIKNVCFGNDSVQKMKK